MKDNAWFVGFAPRDNPEIVVVALWEHGVHGQFAAAIVRDVIKAYFDKKQRVTELRQGQTKLAAAMGLGVPGRRGPEAEVRDRGAAIVTGAMLGAEVPARQER
jgi:penicillin-binding protein 2